MVRALRLLAVVILYVSTVSCGGGEDINDLPEVKIGNKIVEKIDEYRRGNGRLPESLEEAGVDREERDGFFYERNGVNEYSVWFGEGLGESVTFRSESREWRREN